MASSPASPGTSYTIVFLVDPKRRHPLSNGCYKWRFLILEFQVMRKSKEVHLLHREKSSSV